MPWLEAFLGGTASIPTARGCPLALHSPLRSASCRICLARLPTGLEALAPRDLAPRVPPSLIRRAGNGHARNGNLDPLSIAYGARPRLRPASPAADQHGCGTLGHSVGGIRTPLALLMPTFALPAAPPSAPDSASRLTGTLPYHGVARPSAASVTGLSPGGLSAPRHSRPVSYYALFQGWLLLSQPPGCLRAATTLPTEPVVRDLSRRSGLFPSRRRIFAPAVSRPAPAPRHSSFGSGR